MSCRLDCSFLHGMWCQACSPVLFIYHLWKILPWSNCCLPAQQAGGAYSQLHPSDYDPTNTTLFIGGLSSSVTEEDLSVLFGRYGDIVYTKIPPGKGCGFVQFVQRSAAEAAMGQMQVLTPPPDLLVALMVKHTSDSETEGKHGYLSYAGAIGSRYCCQSAAYTVSNPAKENTHLMILILNRMHWCTCDSILHRMQQLGSGVCCSLHVLWLGFLS